MMKYRYILSFILLLLLSENAIAQYDERTVYEKALSAYSIGRFDESLSYLQDVKRTYSTVYRVSMYRLAALCYLATDDELNARKAVQNMLKANPYYMASAKDPVKLTAMVESLRKSSVTLVTASGEAESPEESPLPTVIITADMIQQSGARNMRELLTLYVPGMAQVETLQQPSVSYRGIYSSEQENILVMINGHRLNNRSLNSKNLDYGISLNNIKQIEVLRGPASSLYGNTALSGVVNIITKNGGDVDAVELSAAAGNFGTQQYTALIGKRFNDFDISCWATVTDIKGERYYIPVSSPVNYTRNGSAYSQIGAYAHHPSYDLGLSLTYKDFRLQYGRNYSRYTLPMTDNSDSVGGRYASLPYDVDKYIEFEGERPGNGILNNYFDFSYNKDITDRLSVEASLYIDYDEMRGYSPDANVPSDDKIKFKLSQWEETTKGLTLKARYKYGLDKLGRGSLLFAVQSEFVTIGEMSSLLYETVDSSVIKLNQGTPLDSKIVSENTHESTHSMTLQIKHYFTNSLIFNTGARLDYRRRVGDNHDVSLQPRLSLIYSADRYNVKFSYARSFVELPYYYRIQMQNNANGQQTDCTTNLGSLQLTLDYHPHHEIWNVEANMFYHHLNNGFYDNNQKTKSDMLGMEAMFRCKYKGLHTNANITWQRVMSSTGTSFTGSRINNVPAIFGNDILGYDFSLRKKHHFSVNVITRFSGSQCSPYVIQTSNADECASDAGYTLPARCIFDVGIHYAYHRLSCQLDAYNLLDTQYAQGGTTYYPYQQMGRNVIFKVKISLF